MFLFFLSNIVFSLNISQFIDGIENVEFYLNSTDQEAYLYVIKEEILLFYQKIPNLQIKINNEGREIKDISNPYQLPKNSIVRILTNWSKYSQIDNFLVGFVDGRQCDVIYYSNSDNCSFPSERLYNLKLCYYHFTKNSIIIMGEKNYSKTVLIDVFDQNITMISPSKDYSFKKLNGIAQVYHNKNILADDDYSDLELEKSGGSSMLTLAILFNIAGILLYYIFGFAFGTTCCDKLCSCSCCCCCKSFWSKFNIQNLNVDDRDNIFFNSTLNSIMAHDKRIENLDEE